MINTLYLMTNQNEKIQSFLIQHILKKGFSILDGGVKTFFRYLCVFLMTISRLTYEIQ